MGAQDFDAAVLAATLDSFGEAVSYAPRDGTAFELLAEFHEEHARAGEGEVVRFSTRHIQLTVRLADFTLQGVEPRQGDRVTVRGIGYSIADVQPDGFGAAVLPLVAGDDPDF